VRAKNNIWNQGSGINMRMEEII